MFLHAWPPKTLPDMSSSKACLGTLWAHQSIFLIEMLPNVQISMGVGFFGRGTSWSWRGSARGVWDWEGRRWDPYGSILHQDPLPSFPRPPWPFSLLEHFSQQNGWCRIRHRLSIRQPTRARKPFWKENLSDCFPLLYAACVLSAQLHQRSWWGIGLGH